MRWWLLSGEMSKDDERIDDQDQQQQQLLQQKGDMYNMGEISLLIFKSTIMMDKDIGEM